MKITKLYVALAITAFVVAVLASSSAAAPQGDQLAAPAVAEPAGSIAMPISDGDQMPDFERSSQSWALSQVPLPSGGPTDNDEFNFLLVMFNDSTQAGTLQPPLKPMGPEFDESIANGGRPMLQTRRPPEDAMPLVAEDPRIDSGLRAVWLESADDGSVAPREFAPVDTPSVTVDPLVLIGPNGRVQVQSDDPYTSKNLLLMGGNLRARDLQLGGLPAKLELDALRFNITDAVTIDPRCEIITHVRDEPAGLDLEADTLLNIADSGRIKLYFHSAPSVEGIHWGMRSVGDRRAEFAALIESGKITVGLVYNGAFTISPAVVIYDGQYTYITIDLPKYDRPIHSQAFEGRTEVPEPATMALLALGGVALIRRRK